MVKLYAFADEADRMIDGQISAMLRNGLSGLEIRGVDGINVSQITLEKAKEVRKKMDDNGLQTWAIGSPIGKIRMDEDFEKHLQMYSHSLEVADILGAKNIRIFSFFMGEDDPTVHRNAVIDRLGQFLEIAAPAGITLCHENEKGIYGAVPENCLDLHRTYPQLRGVFDSANFVQCGVDTLQAWQMLSPYIDYLHIKDALPDGQVVPAGKGAGNVAAIVKAYLAMGGTAMTLEPHLTVFDGLKDLEEDGNTSAVGGYTYSTADEAFDAAAAALEFILREV